MLLPHLLVQPWPLAGRDQVGHLAHPLIYLHFPLPQRVPVDQHFLVDPIRLDIQSLTLLVK